MLRDRREEEEGKEKERKRRRACDGALRERRPSLLVRGTLCHGTRTRARSERVDYDAAFGFFAYSVDGVRGPSSQR